MFHSRKSFLIFALSCLIQLSHAQQSETGLPAFGSFHGGTFDNVNLLNGNLHLELPIFAIPRRNSADLRYKFIYDARSWQNNKYSTGTNTYAWRVTPTPHEFTDWNFVTEPTSLGVTYDTVNDVCTNSNGSFPYIVRTNYVVTDQHGTRHPFELRWAQQPGNGCGGITGNQQTGAALDGSGILLDIGPNGSTPSYQLTDNENTLLNGNSYVSQTGSAAYQFDASGHKTSETRTFQDSNGNNLSFRIDYAQVAVNTHYCVALTTPCSEYSGAFTLPQTLTLPDGRAYTFTFSTDGNADLIQIDLPTGGYLAYAYKTISHSTPPTGTQRGISQFLIRRSVTSRTVSDGTTAENGRSVRTAVTLELL